MVIFCYQSERGFWGHIFTKEGFENLTLTRTIACEKQGKTASNMFERMDNRTRATKTKRNDKGGKGYLEQQKKGCCGEPWTHMFWREMLQKTRKKERKREWGRDLTSGRIKTVIRVGGGMFSTECPLILNIKLVSLVEKWSHGMALAWEVFMMK